VPHKTLAYLRENILALLALFVALGGSSYAALSLPAGSVGTRQLRNGAVTSRKLAKHAVTAANLDPESIPGHIADWAQIRSDGHVTSSRPNASVSLTDPTRGIYRVFWHRSIQLNCIAMANPTNVPTVLGQASADTLGPFGRGRNTYFIVQTFDASGNNVPESVNVVVICP
jgi:hypothetical protein